MMKQDKDLPMLFFADQQALEDWLEKNGSDSQGIWMQIAKKRSKIVSVSYDEAVESALCFGWIDSQKKAFDEDTWIQRFTPRSPKSIWSKVNREKVESLMASGRMRPAGIRAMEAAKISGAWEKAYEPQREINMPEDFQAALENHPQAKAFYETINSQNRYAILFRIHNAVKPQTREKRIAEFVAMLEKGETLYPMPSRLKTPAPTQE